MSPRHPLRTSSLRLSARAAGRAGFLTSRHYVSATVVAAVTVRFSPVPDSGRPKVQLLGDAVLSGTVVGLVLMSVVFCQMSHWQSPQ
jgi:hypothetical protein